MRARLAWITVLGLVLIAAGATAGDPPARPDIRSFRPSANGFAFVNRFEGSPLPGPLAALGGLAAKAGAPSVFGLCGGMSFAAADLFLAGRSPPTRAAPPGQGNSLFDYIQQRQLTSFGPGMRLAGRFGRWMSLPDEGQLGTRMLTLGELHEIVGQLGEGHPVVLGLVFNHHAGNHEASGPAGAPWENHQVLAYGVRADAPPGTIELRIYDPNYPHSDDAVIVCRVKIVGSSVLGPLGGVRAPVLGMACERRVESRKPTPIRGLFAMPYSGVTPPEKLE